MNSLNITKMKFNNRNVWISPNAKIGLNTKIGDNTVIYDNVIIGDNTIIANDCVIGEPNNDYYHNRAYLNPETIIGSDSLIRSHAIIYAGSSFGKGFSCGHRVTIRENSKFGANCRLGTLCDIQGHSIFGNNCWLHSNVHIGHQSNIGNFVFIYPYVVLTNDPSPPSNICTGVTIGDYSVVAVSCVLLPAIKIGKHVLIGAGSIVGKDIDDYSLAIGNPAKVIKDIRDLKSRETGKSYYPWPYNFERGMPWENIGFDEWKKNN